MVTSNARASPAAISSCSLSTSLGSVERLRPLMRASMSVDELRRYAHMVACLSHASLKHIGDIELVPIVRRSSFLPLN